MATYVVKEYRYCFPRKRVSVAQKSALLALDHILLRPNGKNLRGTRPHRLRCLLLKAVALPCPQSSCSSQLYRIARSLWKFGFQDWLSSIHPGTWAINLKHPLFCYLYSNEYSGFWVKHQLCFLRVQAKFGKQPGVSGYLLMKGPLDILIQPGSGILLSRLNNCLTYWFILSLSFLS